MTVYVHDATMTEDPALKPYLDVLAARADNLMRVRNIVGVGLSYTLPSGERSGEPVIEVYLRSRQAQTEETDDLLHPFRELRVSVVETGDVLHAASGPSLWCRPLEGGTSIGAARHNNAGTLGGWALDRSDGSTVLLTCAHVLLPGADVAWWPAATKRLRRLAISRALVERGVVQPGRADGGRRRHDRVADTKRATRIPLSPFYGRARVSRCDAAIATPLTEHAAFLVRGAGQAVFRKAAPVLDMRVQKHGRSTAFTDNGVISAVGQILSVPYGPAWGRLGIRQSVFSVRSLDGRPFALEGDSGALVVQQDSGSDFPVVVGMVCGVQHFNDQPVGTAVIVATIEDVFDELGLTTL